MANIKLDIAFHPGEELKEKLQEMKMTSKQFAEETQLTEEYINNVIACQASVSPKDAVAFEMVTAIPATLWLKMQHDYDDYVLSQKKSNWIESFLKFAKPSRVAVL